MSLPRLPGRPNLDWLRKTAKQSLEQLRATQPQATLADAQLALARAYGFPSWRKLKQHVEASQSPQFDDDSIKAFFELIGSGQLDAVRTRLAESPALVHAVGPHPFWGGRPQALHVAIETKRRDLFDLLLDAGADPSGDNSQYDHWSPLMLAINREQPDMQAELIRRGADIGIVEALMLADDARLDEILRDTSLPTQVPNAGSLLMFARTTHAIDRLLDFGVPADLIDRWGTSPAQALSRLGEKGQPLVAHLNACTGANASPEQYARLGDQPRLAALIEGDPSIAKSDPVLLAAVEHGHHAIAACVLSRGANPNARTGSPARSTALHVAAWNGDLAMAQLLVESGADLTLRDAEHNGTPAGWADAAITIRNEPKCRAVADYLNALDTMSHSSNPG